MPEAGGPAVDRRSVLAALCGLTGCTSTNDNRWKTDSPTAPTTPTATPEPPGVNGDWCQYWHDPTHAGFGPEERGPHEDVEVAWTFEGDEVLDAAPVVADRLAFVSGTMAGTYAVDVTTGESRWESRVRSGSGMAIADGTLYVGTVPGEIAALDAADGTRRWTTEIGDLFAGPPTVVDGVVFGCCRGTFASLDADTGETLWTVDLAGWTDPASAVVDGVVYVGDREGTAYAFDATTGEEIWQVELHGSISAAPAVRRDVVYFISGSIFALDRATGEQRWRSTPPGLVATPPVVTDDVVVAGQGTKVAFDADTGDQRWRYDEIDWRSSEGTPATAADDTIYVSGPDGNVHALDLETGDRRWQYSVDGDPAAAPVAVDGLLLVTDSAWQLIALRESESR